MVKLPTLSGRFSILTLFLNKRIFVAFDGFLPVGQLGYERFVVGGDVVFIFIHNAAVLSDCFIDEAWEGVVEWSFVFWIVVEHGPGDESFAGGSKDGQLAFDWEFFQILKIVCPILQLANE